MSDRNSRKPGRITGSPSPRRRTDRRARLRAHTLELVRTGRLPAFLLSVGLAVMLGAFAVSDDFLVDTVVVRGNSIAYADAVVEQSDALGQSMFQINTHDVAERVSRHPAVDHATVRVALPDRVVVDVVEREPAIVWQTGDRAVLIDQYGWVLAEGESSSLPWVVELEGTLPQPGEHMDPGKVAAVQYLNEQIGSSAALEYDEYEGFQAYLGNGQVVTFGGPEDLPVKIEVLTAMNSLGEEWTRLDVRDPDRPVYQ